MLILQALFLWLIVSTLMVGGAMLFHRRFPGESPWLGFIVPPLLLVLAINFIEHLFALPVLLYLMPLFLGAAVWMLVSKKYFKQALILPTAVFLASFAFTFLVRCLQPDIDFTSDGISDLNMINNFSQGEALPPPDTWMPNLRYEWYYDMQHYAASVLERLLNVKIGTAYNVSHALLSALICVVGAGAAHRISGGKILVTLAIPLLLESAATGSSAFVYLGWHDSNPDLWMAYDLSSGMAHPPDTSWFWPWLHAGLPAAVASMSPDDLLSHQTLRLQVPGFWTWRSEYHANASGHLLTLLSVLLVAELVHEKRSVWPWVLALVMPLLAATTSAWALPITTLLCWVILPLAWFCGRRPTAVREVVMIFFVALTLLWPAFYATSSAPQMPAIIWTDPLNRVPLREFLVQWWPVILLWGCACACFRELSFGLRWMLIVVPVMLIGIETITIESRYNTIEKMWGYVWAVGFYGFFAFVASRPAIGFRLVASIIVLHSLVSLGFFTRSVVTGAPGWDSASFHLEGSQFLTADDEKGRILKQVGQTKHAVYLTGKCAFCYNDAPAVTTFTKNKSYIAWSWFEHLTNDRTEPELREALNNDFYSGKMTDRLAFLKLHQIEGVIIWPDDNISSDDLTKLQQELDSTYVYVDCKSPDSTKTAGVFIRRPSS